MFLFQSIDSIREYAPLAYQPLADYVVKGLNPTFELRPYQEEAFRNFITFYENETKRPMPTQVLFHMATGSGKTLIMAGLIIYLYKKGYRNFMFFVNLDNIVKKTKDNFLNKVSEKYLFANSIVIDGETVKINEVTNFQNSDGNSINILFTTTQGLHSALWMVREDGVSFDDFIDQKVVLISDEAHHLNSDTKKGKKGSDDDSSKSWEYTVNRIFGANKENILLEFTATCDLKNPYILAEYENKIIFNYPLKKFREDKYSKEVKAIRADLSHKERALQALMFSQYRLKVFQDNRLSIKPVVLFKSKTIAESKAFYQQFIDIMKNLTGADLEKIIDESTLPQVKKMSQYFLRKNIDFNELAQELSEDFSEEKCISVNDDKEADDRQIILNSLESKSNHYRAIFEVKKLDEGWDVLNLFDIVRLYETRDASKGVPGSTTIQEAQLIGRGARYCPFIIEDGTEKCKRKYDNDIENPLRICEELFYHCQYDSRYIDELNKALIATGIIAEDAVDVRYILKEEFKKDQFYLSGSVFVNKREVKSRKEVVEILPSIKNKEYFVSINAMKMAMDTMMMNAHTNTTVKTYFTTKSVEEIAKFNYSIPATVVRRFPVFKFSTLKQYFPNLHTMREFITSEAYLGGVKIKIESREQEPSPITLFEACLQVFEKIGNEISSIQEDYFGTQEFYAKKISEVFKDKTLHITDPHGEGEGVSQNALAIRPAWKIDLSDKEWFAFNDNYGTTEEKAFVAYFASHVGELQKKYDNIYLIRNERQLVLYSFDGGERFEPYYLIFLRKKNSTGYDQYQIFVEPKGSHLIATDGWKERFLLQIASMGVPVKTFVDDVDYHIWGFPFFNQVERSKEFGEAINKLLI